MKLTSLLLASIATLLLTAASCAPQPEQICLSFSQFQHNQIAKTPIVIGDWEFRASPPQASSLYPDSFRFYDPSNDRGPVNHKGPEIDGGMKISPLPGRRNFSELTIEYVNDSTVSPVVRLLDAGSVQVAAQTIAAEPQNTALSLAMKSNSFAHIYIEGHEFILGKICVR